MFIYARWQKLALEGLSLQTLNRFHAQHKYIFMSHNQAMAKELGHWLAQAHAEDPSEVLPQYLTKMMTLLKLRASRKGHVNTLHHLQGYLKNFISADDKTELVDIIDQYRNGLLPLIVPITLLRHHFRRFPNDYITDSYYMKPHPKELMLLNSL